MNATTLRSGFVLGGAAQLKGSYAAARPSQNNVAHRRAHAPLLDIDVTMRRSLRGGNERSPREIGL
jgi:hypothetical protein